MTERSGETPSDTPRTDAFIDELRPVIVSNDWSQVATSVRTFMVTWAEYARNLERELAEAKKAARPIAFGCANEAQNMAKCSDWCGSKICPSSDGFPGQPRRYYIVLSCNDLKHSKVVLAEEYDALRTFALAAIAKVKP